MNQTFRMLSVRLRCHYLYHAGDVQRRQLLEYVRDYYTGAISDKESKGKHLEARFGMSAEELGQAVLAYAKAQVAVR